MERHRADTRATLSLDLLEVISPECQLIVKCHDRACEQCVKKGLCSHLKRPSQDGVGRREEEKEFPAINRGGVLYFGT